MATRFHIAESSDSLHATVQRHTENWERILTAAVMGACVGFASFYFLPGYWWKIAAPVALVAGFFASLQAKRVELRVTKVEFFTQGNLGMRFRLGQAVCTSDARWLEFRGNGGSENSDEAQGLYAVTSRGSACLLPFVSEQHVVQLIGEIEKKFPFMAERWRSESAFGSDFVSLGISGNK